MNFRLNVFFEHPQAKLTVIEETHRGWANVVLTRLRSAGASDEVTNSLSVFSLILIGNIHR